MEWLWRMVTNPGRMVARYSKSFIVLPGHLFRSVVRTQD
jgi:UDP-N-acetyl-D-mannosaminuronic acid transferase (WecB/TagA/CpsF family)